MEPNDVAPCIICGMPDQKRRNGNEIFVCDEHLSYAHAFQPDKLKEILGRQPAIEYKCEVCDKKLTKEEADGVEINHFHVTCSIHREYAGHLFLEELKERLHFINNHN